jgi:succinyl-CoA synthetase beta subunit
MPLSGMLHRARLCSHVGFPAPEVFGANAHEDAIQALIDRHGLIFLKPVFRGGVGKKGKAGLTGRACTLREPLTEKERLYFAEHYHGNTRGKTNGVTFEAGIAAEHEVYFSITGDTRFRAPTMTLTRGGAGRSTPTSPPGAAAATARTATRSPAPSSPSTRKAGPVWFRRRNPAANAG